MKNLLNLNIFILLIAVLCITSCDTTNEPAKTVSTNETTAGNLPLAQKDSILSCIGRWNLKKDDSTVIYNEFKEANSTVISFPTGFFGNSTTAVHAYPILTADGSLELVFISALHDKVNLIDSNLLDTNYIVITTTDKDTSFADTSMTNVLNDTISDTVAIKRMNRFIDKEKLKNYVGKNTKDDKMFKAIRIPREGLEENVNYRSFLALKRKDPNTPSVYQVDFIIKDQNGQTIIWEDMVKPVPPFGSEDFGMLQVVL